MNTTIHHLARGPHLQQASSTPFVEQGMHSRAHSRICDHPLAGFCTQICQGTRFVLPWSCPFHHGPQVQQVCVTLGHSVLCCWALQLCLQVCCEQGPVQPRSSMWQRLVQTRPRKALPQADCTLIRLKCRHVQNGADASSNVAGCCADNGGRRADRKLGPWCHNII